MGAVLYRGITGTVPDDATARVMDDGLVPAAQAKAGKFSKTFTDAVDWALQLRSDDRPQSVQEWRGLLEGGASRRRQLAASVRADKPPAPVRKRGKGPWLAVLGVVAVLAVGSAAYWWDEIADLFGNGLSSKVSEVHALLAKGEFGGAQRALEEARRLGLDAQTGRELEAAIEKSVKRTAALAAFRGALARRDYAAARAALDRARALGLPEAAYRTHLAAIDKRKAEDLQRSAGSCAAHEAAGRLAAALDCYRKVLAQQPDDAVAKAKVRTLVPRVAWSAAQAKNTAEAYHAFLQAHSGSAFAGAARQRLEDLEIPNWRVAKAANTRAAYAHFLKIYPNGTFAGIAKKRLSERAN